MTWGMMPPVESLDGEWLFIATADVGSDGPYVCYIRLSVPGGRCVSYGPCPVAALSLIGRNPPSASRDMVSRFWRASDAAYRIESGQTTAELVGCSAGFDCCDPSFPSKRIISAFLSGEEAVSIVSAMSGWPEPVALFGNAGKGISA